MSVWLPATDARWCAGCAAAPTAPGRFSFRVAVMVRAGQAGAGRAHSRRQQVRNASFQGQSGLILRMRSRACVPGEPAGDVPDTVAERIGVGVPQVRVVAEAEETGPRVPVE